MIFSALTPVCFLLLATEILLSGVVLAPWPHVLRKKIFRFLNENPIVSLPRSISGCALGRWGEAGPCSLAGSRNPTVRSYEEGRRGRA